MIHELRRYRLKVGAIPKYLEAFETYALPAVHTHMNLLAFWTADIGDIGCVFHLWEFEDHAHRIACYAGMRSEPIYRDEFAPIALPLVEEMHSEILNPVEFAKHLPLIKGR